MSASALPLTLSVPVLDTARLRLRAPMLADFPHHAAFHASDRSRFEGGPRDARAAWRIWASDAGLWLLRGYGPFGVDDRDSGAYLGEVGVFQAEGYPGPELGWFVLPEAEGRGIAFEAARAVMGWLRARFDWDEIISIIDPANARSLALGARLGGVIDRDRRGTDDGDVVIVHDLRRLA
jgi:RimJ/RimL family protein N-acetyltransferase